MKDIQTLRNHLFDQLERLAQSNTKEEIDQEISKSEQVVNLSDALLRTAQVEAAVMASVKNLNSAFIPDIMQEITMKQIERDKKPVEFTKPTNQLLDEIIPSREKIKDNQ